MVEAFKALGASEEEISYGLLTEHPWCEMSRVG
jgi:hypothetical protein